MALRLEQQKSELIDRIAVSVRERLSENLGDEVERFVRFFYRHVPPSDMLYEEAEDLYGAAVGLWQFGAHRPSGSAKIRAFNPTYDEHGWHTGHTVIEAVNDDMPFLVDSLTQALSGLGLKVHLVIHPIVGTTRDADGARTSLCESTDTAGAVAESYMHIEVDEQTSADTLKQIEETLTRVLSDVRISVTDWPQMRERMQQLISEVQGAKLPIPSEDVSEIVDFMRWMDDNNFTYLGYREYEFEHADGEVDLNIVPDKGLGILREPDVSVFQGMRRYSTLPPDVQYFMKQPQLLMVTKGNLKSTVHRSVYLDTVIVKTFADNGEVNGERVFCGLFTSSAYHTNAQNVPFLRQKVARAMSRAGIGPRGHDGKTLTHILNSYPRDELFQASEDELLETAMGVLHLQERQRTALFVRKDPYERFVSCLVYVPRDRYNTELRQRIQQILENSFAGTTSSHAIVLGDAVHAQVHFIVDTVPGQIPDEVIGDVEARLVEAARSWSDRLEDALVESKGEEVGLGLFHRYGQAFSTAYRENTIPRSAIGDIDRLEQVVTSEDIAVNLYRPIGWPEHQISFRLYHAGAPVPLSDVLPMLEDMGLKVISELPFDVRPQIDDSDIEAIWIHSFGMETRDGTAIDLAGVRQPFLEAFAEIWHGEMESDGFNRLVLCAGLVWREVVILRAYAKYLRQARFAFSQDFLEDTLALHAPITRLIVELFHARFDLTFDDDRGTAQRRIHGAVDTALDEVDNLDEDRVLRRFANLVDATLRTNFYKPGMGNRPKPFLSFKLDSTAIEELPKPRPMFEVFVYSPRVEAIHLRGGKVARGGIRWSDRREDFRTEVLGLMKAQMVKNAVIVPVGSKGGFVVKRPPPASAGREAFLNEGIECYKTLMRGLLDVTDNLVDGAVAPPNAVIRHDGDDPYLVVAADKGTATFSDIANGISRDYGFWLDDAFASGGSAGYDHKKMGITARGAWESVKRHFREIGTDIQAEPFSVVGVGDMSGDVFGNGMLLSEHIKLVAAFNHLHIFVDPDPDSAVSFAERQRLFDLGRGSWDLYDSTKISEGGAVFDRRAKSIKLSPQIRQRFDIQRATVTPNELIVALLLAESDLLWFGGIGTFVKAHEESQVEARDKANDAVRIDARDLRAKVIGEGANLGVTQRGRIEFSRAGGRINTDFIDNSGGVDCSDHEVNIKILLNKVVSAGDMTVKQRNALLEKMTDEVGNLVLEDNYRQSQAITQTLSEGFDALDQQTRLMKGLERIGRLDRAVELLPHDEELIERQGRREGLTRPELSVLLCYAKIKLYDDLLASDFVRDKTLLEDLRSYFPGPIRQAHDDAILEHPLRGEIIVTAVTNSLVNRTGPTFVSEMSDKTGMGSADVARAYIVVRESFRLRELWDEIDALDNRIDASIQTSMHQMIRRLMDRETGWVLRHHGDDLDVARLISHFQPGISKTVENLDAILYDEARAVLTKRVETLQEDGVPESLAQQISSLNVVGAGLDLVRISDIRKLPLADVAPIYFDLGHQLGIAWLRDSAIRMPVRNHWQKQAAAATVDDLSALQAELTIRVLDGDSSHPVRDLADSWLERRRQPIERSNQLIAELKALDTLDVSMLMVAGRRLRGLVTG